MVASAQRDQVARAGGAAAAVRHCVVEVASAGLAAAVRESAGVVAELDLGAVCLLLHISEPTRPLYMSYAVFFL